MDAENRRLLLLAILALIVAAGLSALRQAHAAGQHRLHLPVVVSAPPPAALLNGDFEQGPAGWTATSSGGWATIVNDLPGSVTPRSGAWAAWLGGAKHETTTLSQVVTVTPARPVLTYWHWVASADVCGYDQASIRVNGLTIKTYALCELSEIHGWTRAAVNLAPFAGQTVAVEFRVTTDASLNSNLFLDDVAFDEAAILAQIEDLPALLPAPGPKADAPDEPELRRLMAGAAE